MLQNSNRNLYLKEKQHLKCGEIFFLADSFLFKCIICEFEIENFLNFRLHFENQHVRDVTCEHETKNTEQFLNFLEEKSVQSKDNGKALDEDSNDPLNWFLDHEKIIENTESLTNKLKSLTNSSVDEIVKQPNAKNTEENSKLEDENIDFVTKSKSLLADGHETEYSIDDYKIDWNEPFKPAQNTIKRPYKQRHAPNSCTFCGRTFRRRYQLDTHIHIHTGEKPHQCEVCGRRFRALTTLQRHLNTHEKIKNYICQFCEKCFTHRAALLSHESRHVQERTISCDECEKKFYTINHCDTHKRRVHKKSNKTLPTLPFACHICNNRYRSASMLSTHKLRKHFKSAKFTCEKCDKKFVDKQNLEQHQNIHTNKVDKT